MEEEQRRVRETKSGTGVNRKCELGCSFDFDVSHLSLNRACALITAKSKS